MKKLSPIQRRIIDYLSKNPRAYIKKSQYYNHNEIILPSKTNKNDYKYIIQFTSPTFEFLLRNNLIKHSEGKNYILTNPQLNNMTPELRKEIRKSRISDSFQKIVECYRDGKTPEGKSIDNISNELYNELFYDMDNTLIDCIEDKIKEIIKSPNSSLNKKPFEILSLLGLYNGEFHDKDMDMGDSKDDECVNKYINVSIDGSPKKERILDRPVAYSLVDIFKELKFGRPAASQQYLQECIEFLEKSGDTPNVSDLPNVSDDKLPNFKFTPPPPPELKMEDKEEVNILNYFPNNILSSGLTNNSKELKIIELKEKFGKLAIYVAYEVLNSIKHEDNVMYYEINYWNEIIDILETK